MPKPLRSSSAIAALVCLLPAVPARAADAIDCPTTPAALVTSLHVNARGEELRFQDAGGTLRATLKERLMPTRSFICGPVKDGADCREDERDAAQLCLVLWSVTGACTSALLAEHLGLDATTPRVQEAVARVQAQITAQPPERLQSWKRRLHAPLPLGLRIRVRQEPGCPLRVEMPVETHAADQRTVEDRMESRALFSRIALDVNGNPLADGTGAQRIRTDRPAAPPTDETSAPGLGGRGAASGSGGVDSWGVGGLGSRGTGGGGTALGIGGLRSAGLRAPGPAPEVVVGPATIVGTLEASGVDEAIARIRNELRFCYEKELMRQPALAGDVVVALTVGPTGKVSGARATSSTMASAAVTGCVLSRFQRLQFPAPEARPATVTTKLTFRASPPTTDEPATPDARGP